jgi:hypothetical protein
MLGYNTQNDMSCTVSSSPILHGTQKCCLANAMMCVMCRLLSLTKFYHLRGSRWLATIFTFFKNMCFLLYHCDVLAALMHHVAQSSLLCVLIAVRLASTINSVDWLEVLTPELLWHSDKGTLLGEHTSASFVAA